MESEAAKVDAPSAKEAKARVKADMAAAAAVLAACAGRLMGDEALCTVNVRAR